MSAGWYALLGLSLALPASGTALRDCVPSVAGGATIAGFADGFESAGLPSGGSGGAHPGEQDRSVAVPGSGTRPYYLYVPPGYAPQRALPLVLALHGASGSPAAADAAARFARADWSIVAAQRGFLVAAPVGSGASGSWRVPADHETLRRVLADVQAAYNVDRSRIFGWGYSAGGHVLHDLMLDGGRPGIDAGTLAGYAVNAGVFAALACNPSTNCALLLSAQARRFLIAIHVGTGDPLLPYAQADRAALLLHGWVDGTTLRYEEFPGGHGYEVEHLAASWEFLCPFRLPP